MLKIGHQLTATSHALPFLRPAQNPVAVADGREGFAATGQICNHDASKRQRTGSVPLSVEAIGQLGLYASLRDMGLVELIAQVLGEAVKKDLVGKILDDIPPKP